MADFVHLHVHSDYSLLQSVATIERIVERAVAFGMRYVALTDDGNLFGMLEFYKQCRVAGVEPIVGCDFFLAPGGRFERISAEGGRRYRRLVLLARDVGGYHNLRMLSSRGYTEGFYYKPRLDDELLSEHSGGLIALCGGLTGDVGAQVRDNRMEEAVARASWYRELFGAENFYLELQDHGIPEERSVNEGVAEVARRLDIPLVATNNCYYVDRADAEAHEVLICIGQNRKLNEGSRSSFSTQEYWLKPTDEIRTLFADYPEAVENSLRVAERCRLELELPGPIFPAYPIPEQYADSGVYLRSMALDGLKRRYPQRHGELHARLEYELDTIVSTGFSDYFLIVWDFVKFARDNDIPVGPGRGSGAGSLVAYSLWITDIDPLKYGLLFERFLNPERVSLPDFDIDFCYERRGEVIEYVSQRYGSDHVGQIITFGRLKAKAVIRDVARVLDIPYDEADAIAKLVPTGPNVDLRQSLESEPALREVRDRGDVYAHLIDVCLKLEGLHRHASTHAAGIVIGQRPLIDYVPLYRDPRTGSTTTQFSMEQLEECGLVKMDILGLKTLTLIEHCVKQIAKRGIEVDIEHLPDNDPKTFRLLSEGKSAAIFQFENTGMRAVLMRAKPERIEDLIALTSLYRPGPIENIEQYIDAKNGKTEIHYPLPQLASVLQDTYGVIIYQEQVMEIVRLIAGFSLGQADILRRAMGKKKPEEMQRMKHQFLEGAGANQVVERDAEGIFDLLLPFAGYGFNKSHAAAYALLAYQTAYLKANFPIEFMAANLTNEASSPDKFRWYLEETRAMGIELRAPDINLSQRHFSVVQGQIVYGLVGVKNIGSSAVEEILRARNADGDSGGFEDFLDRVDLRVINRKVLEVAIQTGLFDSLYPARATLFHNLDAYMSNAQSKRENRASGQARLFDSEELIGLAIEEVPEWTTTEKLGYERTFLGGYFSGHPLQPFRARWKRLVHINIGRPETIEEGAHYTLLGLINNVDERTLRKGGSMVSARLEDFNGDIEVVLFGSSVERYRQQLQNNRVVRVEVRMVSRGERRNAVVEELEVLTDERTARDEERMLAGEVHIRLDDNLDIEQGLSQIRSQIIDNGGDSKLVLHLYENGQEQIIRAAEQFCVSGNAQALDRIRRLPMIREVWKVNWNGGKIA